MENEEKKLNQSAASSPGEESKTDKKKRTLLHRIINIFLYIGIGILILILIFLGFSQTATFRNLLREKIIEVADSSLNGKLYVEKIEGTIFTSLYLKNIAVNMGSDTLFKASVIEVKTSPLQLLLKKIYVRKFEIQNASINLIRDSTGILNLEKLIPPSEEDTTTSEFPFKIQVPDFRLTNVSFSLQDFNKVKSDEVYTNLTMNDLRVKNLNLSLSVFADIKSNEYILSIDKLNCSPNISSFKLDNFSGNFLVSKEKLMIKDLNIATERSEFTIDAELDDFNIFDTTGTSDINNALLSLELKTDKFNFDDLTAFAPSVGILKGSITTDIEASGAIREFELSINDLTFSNTRLNTKAKIYNVLKSDSLYIAADFNNTEIKQSDINSLIPSLNVPVYEEYGLLHFDTLHYEGKLLDFKSNFYLRTDKGNISASAKLNLTNKLMTYDVSYKTEKLDIAPLAGIITSINSNGNVKGKGTDPKNLTAAFNLNAGSSVVDGNPINTFLLKADAENKNIKYDLKLKSDTTSTSFGGVIDFTNENNPSYKLKGTVNNLNFEKFMKDTSFITDLNFNIEAEGENFDPEELNLFLNINLYNSTVNEIKIDSTKVIIDLQREKSGERIINIISDLADITATGNFTLPQTIDLVKSEANLLTDSFKEKFNQYFPANTISKNAAGLSAIGGIIEKRKAKYFSTDVNPVNIDYSVELKDFKLISLLLKDKNLEIDGELSGKLIGSGDSITATLNSKLDYIKYWGKDEVFFLSNFSLDLNLSNSFTSTSSADIFTNLKLKSDRIFAGSDIHNFLFNLDLKNNTADLDFSAVIEDYASARVLGKIDLSGDYVNLDLDTLYLNYRKMYLKNKEKIEISYNRDQIDIKNFILSHGSGDINIKGIFSRIGSQKMKIAVSNFSGEDISTNILELKPENSLKGKINLTADIAGISSDPEMNIDLQMDSINYKNKTFGSLISKFDYKDKNLKVDVKFNNSLISGKEQALNLTGNVPVNLGFEGVKERFNKDKQIDLSLNADNFDLGALGDVLPAVNQLRGTMSSNLKLKGTMEALEPNGSITIDSATFILEANNLEYNGAIKLRVEKETLYLDTLIIENTSGTKNGGRMIGNGQASLNNFEITSSQFRIKGDLKVLGQESKSVSPSVYGDLAIYTNGYVEFKIDEERAYLNAPIVVKMARLTFPPTASAYQNISENFKYKFPSDTIKSLQKEMDFERLISLSKQSTRAKEPKNSIFPSLDYDISIKVEREATIIFIISKELNQKLTAVLEGDFQYKRVSGRPEAQGELKLLEGSTLEFLKTLEAEGSIRFESELTNPYLDIIATYTNYMTPDSSQSSSDEVMVAVKIKIEGPLKELGKNLTQSDNNITVYIGENNIENDNPDPTKDASDAVMFLLLNKFTDTATQQDNSYVASTAASFAGSLVGGFLNKQFGDIVKNVEIRQAGTQTKFSLIGRAGNFHYTIGGSTDVFQDLSRADVKIEYPLYRSLLLRLERKEAISEININNEMVNEVGLKYRFGF